MTDSVERGAAAAYCGQCIEQCLHSYMHTDSSNNQTPLTHAGPGEVQVIATAACVGGRGVDLQRLAHCRPGVTEGGLAPRAQGSLVPVASPWGLPLHCEALEVSPWGLSLHWEALEVSPWGLSLHCAVLLASHVDQLQQAEPRKKWERSVVVVVEGAVAWAPPSPAVACQTLGAGTCAQAALQSAVQLQQEPDKGLSLLDVGSWRQAPRWEAAVEMPQTLGTGAVTGCEPGWGWRVQRMEHCDLYSQCRAASAQVRQAAHHAGWLGEPGGCPGT